MIREAINLSLINLAALEPGYNGLKPQLHLTHHKSLSPLLLSFGLRTPLRRDLQALSHRREKLHPHDDLMAHKLDLLLSHMSEGALENLDTHCPCRVVSRLALQLSVPKGEALDNKLRRRADRRGNRRVSNHAQRFDLIIIKALVVFYVSQN